eukprot:CAMPEP_0197540782 /NCGR_PEP_ID=MMETSP1318-20131121/66783_1 /TAXON_ID=552666 /ORGANISM="Partenskyella glossopodia, Strain RCC365" /LENGTH=316 /DNA_ID=CAMNT_0043099879 /DNA_START=959 /DNA_END=1909 /DNA_ORIENTATION=-
MTLRVVCGVRLDPVSQLVIACVPEDCKYLGKSYLNWQPRRIADAGLVIWLCIVVALVFIDVDWVGWLIIGLIASEILQVICPECSLAHLLHAVLGHFGLLTNYESRHCEAGEAILKDVKTTKSLGENRVIKQRRKNRLGSRGSSGTQISLMIEDSANRNSANVSERSRSATSEYSERSCPGSPSVESKLKTRSHSGRTQQTAVGEIRSSRASGVPNSRGGRRKKKFESYVGRSGLELTSTAKEDTGIGSTINTNTTGLSTSKFESKNALMKSDMLKMQSTTGHTNVANTMSVNASRSASGKNILEKVDSRTPLKET